ncbi:unnamed protein product [Parnassius apollo]|uniref:(apollo) hypothetical protein n=1 Tax=Parnassius apollo TaxID=110799 RepID=A0A8S3XS18_PARAO|nr:unnamed protein product [Parnassius apollo]
MLLRSVEGDTLNPEESAKLLASTFYPEDSVATDKSYHIKIRRLVQDKKPEDIEDLSEEDPAFTLAELETVLKALNPKKAPAQDGLTSDICTVTIQSEKETLRLKRVSEHEASGDGADFSGAFEDGPRNPSSIQSPQLETLSTAISPIPTRTITPQAYSRTHSIPTGDPTTGSFFASIVLFTAIQPSKNTSRNKVIMSDVETASSIKSSQNLSVAPPRPPRSLREKVLTKSSLSKATPSEKLSQPSSHPATGKRPADSAPTDASTTRKNASSHTPTLGTKMSQTSVKSDSSIRSSVCDPVDAAIDKVANWKQEEIPPLPVLSDEELSITSAPESPLSEAPEKGRPSLLFNSNRRLGVEMDMATKEANEMLLRGKEALEMAGNMKRECKLTALESLQSLYEMVLALSDSRSRHKHNLERERSRNAQELMRVERAHNKIITQLMKEMASELGHARTDIKNTLQESKAIRGWLNFETQEPFRKTSDLLKAVTDLDKRIGVIQSNLSQQKQEGADNILSHLRVDLTGVKSSVETLKLQLDEMRRVIEKSENNTKKVLETGQKTLLRLESPPSHPSEEISKTLEHELNGMKSSLKEIDTSIRSGLSILPSADSGKIFQTSIREHLQPIEEHLGAMSSELRTMREQKQRAPSPTAPSLATELAQTGEAATKPKKTYARVAASPPLPKPNHTLIITSTDSKNTAENIIERIREALDTKKTGAKVDRGNLDEDLQMIRRYKSNMATNDIIIGGDANAKSIWWGCKADESRGKIIMETFAELNLDILNVGTTPTFSVYRMDKLCTSIIDITACSPSLLHRIKDWQVDESLCTISSHKSVSFTLEIELFNTTINTHGTRIYNAKKANWSNLKIDLKEFCII